MKTKLYTFFLYLLSPFVAFAEAPISDPTLNTNYIKQLGQDMDQLTTGTNKLVNSLKTTISLGTIGFLEGFTNPLFNFGTNDLSGSLVSSIGSGSTGISTSNITNTVTGIANTRSSADNTFPPADQVRSNIDENLQIPDNTTKLTSEKVAAVRKNLPKTKNEIATYGVALAWGNRTIATRNISDAKEGTQKKLDDVQDSRKSIASNTASNTSIAENFNRLLMTAATANALEATETMEKSGNLSSPLI